MLDARGDIAVVQLVVFSILTPLAIFAITRHVNHGLLGWIFIFAFCIIRLAGAGLLVSAENKGTSSTTALILSSVASGPLLLGTIGILHEVVHSFKQSQFLDVLFYAAHFPISGAVIITAIGGSNLSSSDPSKVKSGLALYKAGSALIFILFLITAAAVVWTFFRHRKDTPLPGGERRLLDALFIAVLFLFVRYLYALLSAVVRKRDFGFGRGNTWIYLGMAVIMEFIVMGLYVGAGVTSRPTKTVKTAATTSRSRRKGRRVGDPVV